MKATEDRRLCLLRKTFHDELSKALNSSSQQDFRRCFASFDTRHATAFYDLYRQVLFQVRGNCEAEFEVICEEGQLLSKFDLLKDLAAQQGLSETTDAGEAQLKGKPSDMVRAQRVAAKLKEVEELSTILEQEDERRTSSVQAKESAEQRLQGKAAMAKSIIDGVDKVHAASMAWNARTAVRT